MLKELEQNNARSSKENFAKNSNTITMNSTLMNKKEKERIFKEEKGGKDVRKEKGWISRKEKNQKKVKKIKSPISVKGKL